MIYIIPRMPNPKDDLYNPKDDLYNLKDDLYNPKDDLCNPKDDLFNPKDAAPNGLDKAAHRRHNNFSALPKQVSLISIIIGDQQNHHWSKWIIKFCLCWQK